jgi:hypothetical protein
MPMNYTSSERLSRIVQECLEQFPTNQGAQRDALWQRVEDDAALLRELMKAHREQMVTDAFARYESARLRAN